MNLRLLVISCALLMLQACILYVPDVEQGNIITEAMVKQVKTGHSQQQVRFLLGSPLIEDPFHQDRWDYFYSIRKGRSKNADKKRLTIIFKNGLVEKIIREG